MDLRLVRETFTERSTIGKLYLDGAYECVTLEDCCRESEPGTWKPELKIPKVTAIPYGRYEVTVTFSQRFGRALPLLLKVPDFDGVRIHAGNTDADTDGCVLVGKYFTKDRIQESIVALSLLYMHILRSVERGKVFLSIEKKHES